SSVNVINQPPVALLAVSPLSATAPANVTASTAASSDPDGTVASSTIDFGDGTLASGPTASHTYATAGTYTVKATVYDNLNASSTATQVVTVSPAAPVSIPHSGWRLMYADSQEKQCENGAAANAIDGNPATLWVTSYCPNSPMPHEIQVDLGATYSISGFQYLPRQDGGVNGDIRGYKFFVSLDGVNWGTPVSSGDLVTISGDQAQKQVTFAAATGRYVRFQATSEVNGNPWAVVAELNVLGSAVYVNGPTVSAVTLSSSTAPAGAALNGTVTLSSMAPAAGAVVSLSSNNTGAATVPTSVTIAPGSTSGNFAIMAGGAGQAAITASYNSTAAAASLTITSAAGAMIPHANWKLLYTDSQETQCENGAAANAFDGNPATNWVTQWCGGSTAMPHELQIDLGAPYSISGFQYLPRQDGGVNGDINGYNFYVSNDGVTWGTAVSTGNLVTIPGDQSLKQVSFSAVSGRYIRFQATSEVSSNPWAVVAELNVLGSAISGPAVGSITVPTIDAAGSATTATVALSAPAPAGGALITLGSSNTDVATVPPSIVVPQGAMSANFTISAAAAPSASQARITASYNGAAVSAVLNVSIGTIANTGWRLLWTDSQETVCENGAATNAFDGVALTNWVTQWCGASPGMPHELQVDMGATHQVSGFVYLPRQDGGYNGNIRQYNFFVSNDGVNWGSPVASGTLVTSAADTSAKQVTFAPVSARYFRLQAVSEVNGNPWAVAAELNILGQ
ncbi:MAG TPA: discoidin domain-containing protein, partial [Terriglobales bacterium]|nr:discoidin domain-containing protein [Terriglobales bacterium]